MEGLFRFVGAPAVKRCNHNESCADVRAGGIRERSSRVRSPADVWSVHHRQSGPIPRVPDHIFCLAICYEVERHDLCRQPDEAGTVFRSRISRRLKELDIGRLTVEPY